MVAGPGGPTIEGTTLLVTGTDWIQALDVAGPKPVPLWTATTSAPLQSPSKYSECQGGRAAATVTGDTVLVCGTAPNAGGDGGLAWRLERDDIGSIVAAGDVLYTAAYHSDLVQGVDVASGKVLWEHRLPEDVKQSVGWLCPLGGRLVLGNYSAMVFCLGNPR